MVQYKVVYRTSELRKSLFARVVLQRIERATRKDGSAAGSWSGGRRRVGGRDGGPIATDVALLREPAAITEGTRARARRTPRPLIIISHNPILGSEDCATALLHALHLGRTVTPWAGSRVSTTRWISAATGDSRAGRHIDTRK